jgi:hypothetical protein
MMNSSLRAACAPVLAAVALGVVACGSEVQGGGSGQQSSARGADEHVSSVGMETGRGSSGSGLVVTPQMGAREQLLDEGFRLTQQYGRRDPTAPHAIGLDVLENSTTGEVAYMSSDTSTSTPILVMLGNRVERQLGDTSKSYVGMTDVQLRDAGTSGGTADQANHGIAADYGTNSYTCCVQTCVNNDLANIGCTGVGNLLPYCTSAAAIFSAGCAFSCLNDSVSCAIAPNCGCGPVCGDGICDLANGENCSNCQQDCGPCGGGGGGGGGGDDDDDDDDCGGDLGDSRSLSAYEECVDARLAAKHTKTTAVAPSGQATKQQ